MKSKINNIAKYIKHNYASHNYRNIKKLIKTKPINVLIEALEIIENVNIIKYFLVNTISEKNNLLGKFFEMLNFKIKLQIIETSNSKLIKQIFDDIEVNQAFNFLEDVPQELKKRILISISPDVRKDIIKLSKYDEDEIGQIMNPFLLKGELNWTIAETTQYLSENREEISINGILYVINELGVLKGSVNVHDVLLEKNKNKSIESIIDKTVITVSTDDEIEDVILLFQKYDLPSIPVINSKKELVGVLSDNDIISVISEETTDDIYKMYGITELTKPYMITSVLTIVKSRIFWLILLMIVSTLTSAMIDLFTQLGVDLVSGLTTIFLIPIIPVITGASGNAGSQSAATVIRSLSIGEISQKDYRRVILKEFNVAIVIASILAIINYARLIVYFSIRLLAVTNDTGLTDSEAMITASVTSIGISLSLFTAIVLSKMIGSLLPILALKINVDPASMASPLLTTIIDTLTTILLFSIGLGFMMLAPPI